jgi:hypothetical protein
MPDSNTHNPSHVIKAELVTQNSHNIYTHKSLNITSLAAWKDLQANEAYVSIKSKLM